jgi:Cof subfamily protein (haloacid dehalogenase superfamily)
LKWDSPSLAIINMPVRLIAVDLDGTLLGSDGEISSGNRGALAAAADQGSQVVIVTGRRYHSASRYLCELHPGTVLISSNGARIASAAGEVLYRNFLPKEVARRVIEAAPQFRGYAVAFFDVPGYGQVVVEKDAARDGPVAWYLRNSQDCVAESPSLPDAILSDPVQVMFGGPPGAIDPVEGVLRASPAAARCHLTWTKYLQRGLSLLDVLNEGCSKGSALAYWARRCGIEREEVMAIGDNQNDLEMLQFAGRPVLMRNHNYEQAPDGWSVTLSNDEDGVAEAIRRHVLSSFRR